MRRSNFPPNTGGINDWGLTYNTDYAVSTRKKRDNEKRISKTRFKPIRFTRKQG